METIAELVKLIGPNGLIITLFTGPIGLLISLVVFLKGLDERRKLKVEIEKLKAETPKVLAETEKLKAETPKVESEISKLDAETFRIQVETSRVPFEVEKIKEEAANTRALALSNRIAAERARLNVEEIEKCIDQILSHAEAINSGLFDTYKVFFKAGVSTREIEAAYDDIVKFIVRDDHRSVLRGYASRLIGLLGEGEIEPIVTEDIAHTVDAFGYEVSDSRDFPKMFKEGRFEGSEDDIASIQSWVYDVRDNYQRLTVILNTVFATVRKKASQPHIW